VSFTLQNEHFVAIQRELEVLEKLWSQLLLPCTDSNADCDGPQPTEVNGDSFPSYEWILGYGLQDHKVLTTSSLQKILSAVTEQSCNLILHIW